MFWPQTVTQQGNAPFALQFQNVSYLGAQAELSKRNSLMQSLTFDPHSHGVWYCIITFAEPLCVWLISWKLLVLFFFLFFLNTWPDQMRCSTEIKATINFSLIQKSWGISGTQHSLTTRMRNLPTSDPLSWNYRIGLFGGEFAQMTFRDELGQTWSDQWGQLVYTKTQKGHDRWKRKVNWGSGVLTINRAVCKSWLDTGVRTDKTLYIP